MISLVSITIENFHLYRDEILRIERSSFLSPWSLRAFQEEIQNPVSRLWVLLWRGVPSGHICFWMLPGEIHLMNLAVRPEERGKGFGRYLLTKMIERGTVDGSQVVWLEVRPSNQRARALYEKAGFTEMARRPRYYRDTKEDAILMALPLSKILPCAKPGNGSSWSPHAYRTRLQVSRAQA